MYTINRMQSAFPSSENPNWRTFLGLALAKYNCETPPQYSLILSSSWRTLIPYELSGKISYANEKPFFGKKYSSWILQEGVERSCFLQVKNSAVCVEFVISSRFHFLKKFIDTFFQFEVRNGISHSLCLKCFWFFFYVNLHQSYFQQWNLNYDIIFPNSFIDSKNDIFNHRL